MLSKSEWAQKEAFGHLCCSCEIFDFLVNAVAVFQIVDMALFHVFFQHAILPRARSDTERLCTVTKLRDVTHDITGMSLKHCASWDLAQTLLSYATTRTFFELASKALVHFKVFTLPQNETLRQVNSREWTCCCHSSAYRWCMTGVLLFICLLLKSWARVACTDMWARSVWLSSLPIIGTILRNVFRNIFCYGIAFISARENIARNCQEKIQALILKLTRLYSAYVTLIKCLLQLWSHRSVTSVRLDISRWPENKGMQARFAIKIWRIAWSLPGRGKMHSHRSCH